MRRIPRHCWISFLLIIFLSTPAALGVRIRKADADSPYRVSLSGETDQFTGVRQVLLSSQRNDSEQQQLKDPIRFRSRIPGVGFLTIKLTSYRRQVVHGDFVTYQQTKPLLLFRGFALRRRGAEKIRATGSLYDVDGKPHLHLLLQPGGRQARLGRAYYLQSYLQGGRRRSLTKVRSLPLRLLRTPSTCGAKALGDVSTDSATPKTLAAAAEPQLMQTISVATVADSSYYNRYGDNTNAHIATLVDAASAIYESDLKLRLQVAQQYVFTKVTSGPQQSTDINQSLNNLRLYGESAGLAGGSQVTHLFTGLDFSGTAVGLAYIGVICSQPQFAYSITQYFHPAADPTLIAHEIGHNLGGHHDWADQNSVMAPHISVPGSNYFSSYLATAPQCLTETLVVPREGATPPVSTPEPTIPPVITPIPEITVPEFMVRASIRQNKRLRIASVVKGVGQGCTFSLHASSSRFELESGQGGSVLSIVPQVARKQILYRRVSRRTNARIFFRGKYSCLGEPISLYSNIVSVNPGRIDGPTVSASAWLTQLARHW
jgi:Metallo-peptidase family M12